MTACSVVTSWSLDASRLAGPSLVGLQRSCTLAMHMYACVPPVAMARMGPWSTQAVHTCLHAAKHPPWHVCVNKIAPPESDVDEYMAPQYGVEWQPIRGNCSTTNVF